MLPASLYTVHICTYQPVWHSSTMSGCCVSMEVPVTFIKLLANLPTEPCRQVPEPASPNFSTLQQQQLQQQKPQLLKTPFSVFHQEPVHTAAQYSGVVCVTSQVFPGTGTPECGGQHLQPSQMATLLLSSDPRIILILAALSPLRFIIQRQQSMAVSGGALPQCMRQLAAVAVV